MPLARPARHDDLLDTRRRDLLDVVPRQHVEPAQRLCALERRRPHPPLVPTEPPRQEVTETNRRSVVELPELPRPVLLDSEPLRVLPPRERPTALHGKKPKATVNTAQASGDSGTATATAAPTEPRSAMVKFGAFIAGTGGVIAAGTGVAVWLGWSPF